MNLNALNKATTFSIDDLIAVYEIVDCWAKERAELRHVGKNVSIVGAMVEPRFSKLELLLAFEATLDSIILDQLN
ncbi:hypothetical protein [Brevundimonas sp.]|uniref:hypothetical protein n=1 Tax=Brevundimonas sp. TaxID=1871086 RepID=UPI0028A27C3C|nr:hypothetical protein [Brevundimonas sp.]